LGMTPMSEPAQKLVTQGIVKGRDGEKMSKSKGNVVSPREIIEQFGADKPVAQPLLKAFFILERHEKPRTHESHFGALSCVAPSFLASSTPCLQFACIGPRISAHLEKAFTASSK